MGLFGQTKPRDPKERVREWTSAIRKEGRKVQREIATIQRKEAGVVKSIKDAAKKGNTDVCKILAKEVIQSRKAVAKLYSAKAQMNSVEMQMKTQLANLRIAGSLAKSTDVMKSMSSLVKVPEIQQTMMELSKEMTKAGIMEEMMEDTFETMEDQDELEEEVQTEVDKVLLEITKGIMDKAPEAGSASLPSELEGATAAVSDEEEEDVTEMQARLEALRS